jgi:hypothetical protein
MEKTTRSFAHKSPRQTRRYVEGIILKLTKATHRDLVEAFRRSNSRQKEEGGNKAARKGEGSHLVLTILLNNEREE